MNTSGRKYLNPTKKESATTKYRSTVHFAPLQPLKRSQKWKVSQDKAGGVAPQGQRLQSSTRHHRQTIQCKETV